MLASLNGALGLTLAELLWRHPSSRALWVASLATLTAVAVRAVRLPSVGLWFLGTYVFLFYWTPIMYGMPDGFDRSVQSTYAFHTVGGATFWLTAYIVCQGKARSQRRPRPSAAPGNSFKVLALLGAAGGVASVLAVMMQLGGVGAILGGTRLAAKQRGGLLLYVSMYGSLVVPYTAAAYWTLREQVRRLALALLLGGFGMSLGYFLAVRTRTHLVAYVVAFAGGWFLRPRDGDVEHPTVRHFFRERPRRLVGATLCIAFLIVSMFAVRVGRGVYESGGSVTAQLRALGLSGLVRVGTSADADIAADVGYTPTVLKVMEQVPDTHDYLYGSSYYRLLTIGRSERPEETSRLVGRWFSGGNLMTIPPGFVGDAYMNFGDAGLLVYLVVGGAMAVFDRQRSLIALLAAAISFTWVFHMVRGNFGNSLIILLLACSPAILLRLSMAIQRHERPRLLPAAPLSSG